MNDRQREVTIMVAGFEQSIGNADSAAVSVAIGTLLAKIVYSLMVVHGSDISEAFSENVARTMGMVIAKLMEPVEKHNHASVH